MEFLRKQIFAVVLGLCAAPAAVAQTVITFDEVPPRTTLTHQYGAKGVHFQSASTYDSNAARSGKSALYSVAPNLEVFFFPGPLVINFDSGQRYVRLYAGTEGPPIAATLTAYDAAGHAIAHDGPRTLATGKVKERLEVLVAEPVIRRVELLYQPDGNEMIDDLEFDGLPPPDVPKTPPVVRVTSPTSFQQTSAGKFTVKGTVVGPGLDSTALIRVHVRRPPGSPTTADYTYPVALVGSGSSRRFSQAVSLGLGPQTIAVDAENTGGLHGQSSVVIDSLPALIRSRFGKEGGDATLGGFAFGSITSFAECAYAVYANGAVALSNSNTSVVRGALFKKWLSLQDPGRFPQLGCPRGDERGVSYNGRAQDFVGGRIYATPSGAFFVPPVFVGAIDALGGEAGTGLPISDPTSDSRPAFTTWLFQQFRRNGVALLSTLEIRGDPPRLYVERQAGDGTLFAGVLRPSNPTIIQAFNCSTTAGPCPVAPAPDEPLFTNAARFCNNKEFDWEALVLDALGATPNPPEWVPIYGHYIQTPIWGVLFDVHLAKGDNPFSHENLFEPCPKATLEALVNGTICPSDWDLKLRPLPGYRWMQPEGRDAVQVEFERVHFQHQLVGYGDPTPGDLVFTSGRFIVDCGHCDCDNFKTKPKFKTEIHPPSVYTAVRTVTYNGRPATEADIWVNRFFAGGAAPRDAVEFDIFPPPRPSPQATLGVSSPGNQTGLVRVTFMPAFPFGPVRVRVTAERGNPSVTKVGEMKMRTDTEAFGFDGRLRVYWTCPNGPCQ